MKHPIFFITGLSLVALMAFFCTSCVNKSNENAESNDTKTIVADEILYVEDFAQFNSHEDLAAHFGEKEVVKGEQYLEEGTVKVLTSTVFPESNHPLTVYWKAAHKNIQYVEVSKMVYDKDFNIRITEDGYWKFKNGLKIGMTIQELQKLNGGVFKFYGLGWDYSGAVLSKNKTFDYYEMNLGYVTKDDGNEPASYDKIVGDTEFTSDNKIANELPLKLVTIKYYFK